MLKISVCGLLKKISEARRAKSTIENGGSKITYLDRIFDLYDFDGLFINSPLGLNTPRQSMSASSQSSIKLTEE